MIKKLQKMGFQIDLVLADSLYGESGVNFIDVLYELKLRFAVAIRSNHTVLHTSAVSTSLIGYSILPLDHYISQRG